MSQGKRPQNSPQQPNTDLPVHMVEQFIENQKQQVIIQAQELRLREKEIDANARLAEKQMTLQAELLRGSGTERRKSFKLIAWFVVGIIALLLTFFGVCIATGHEEFALKVFGYTMYAVTTIAGYWAGRKAEQQKKQNAKTGEIPEANVVN